MGWTRGDIEATIRLVTQEQRQALARRVRGEMERQNLDNVRLSRKAGVSDKTISRIINAKMAPRYSTLERVSVGLGLDPGDLWSDLGHAPTPAAQTSTPDLARDDHADILVRIEQWLQALTTEVEAMKVDAGTRGVEVTQQIDAVQKQVALLLRRRRP